MCLTADVIDDLVTKDVEREKDNNGMKSCQQNNTSTHNYFFWNKNIQIMQRKDGKITKTIQEEDYKQVIFNS